MKVLEIHAQNTCSLNIHKYCICWLLRVKYIFIDKLL